MCIRDSFTVVSLVCRALLFPFVCCFFVAVLKKNSCCAISCVSWLYGALCFTSNWSFWRWRWFGGGGGISSALAPSVYMLLSYKCLLPQAFLAPVQFTMLHHSNVLLRSDYQCVTFNTLHFAWPAIVFTLSILHLYWLCVQCVRSALQLTGHPVYG